MKSFYATLFIFGLLLLLITVNSFFIRHTTDALEQATLALAEAPTAEKLAHLEKYWDQKRPWVSLSVSKSTVDTLTERIAEQRAALECNDPKGFQKASALALLAIDDLRRLERFSIENII